MDPIKVDFAKKSGAGKKQVVIPPEKAALKMVINIIATIVVGIITFYIMLPPLNFKAYEFYLYIGIIIVSFIVISAITSGFFQKPEYGPYVRKTSTVPLILILVVALVVGVGYLVSSVFFRAEKYSEIISVEQLDSDAFSEDILEQSASTFSSIPKLDEDAASILASRAMSELTDLGYVSQYDVYPLYTQINYKEKPVRVVPLKYASIIKWFTNRSTGLPGYIIIDMADSTTEFKSLDSGIKYSPAEHFGRNLKRHLRFKYPTAMFDEPNFEIDDDGNPYWVCAVLDKTIGLFGGTDVKGIVLVYANDENGKSEYVSIEDIKTKAEYQWLDRIYSSDLIIQQYDYYGKYQGGFWNSILGQKNVFVTTEGHNYIAQDDDVLLYTGVTSVTNDQSVTGFTLINQRTKEAKFYRVDGAKESSAMEVAKGMVSDYDYDPTFPLLINIGGEPTYFIALKDKGNVVQRYSMVNVKKYNNVKSVGADLNECLSGYLEALKKAGIGVEMPDVPDGVNPNEPVPETLTGTIQEIQSAVIGGNTTYYFKLSGSEAYFTATAKDYSFAPILKPGDNVKVTFEKTTDSIINVQKIERAAAASETE